MTQLDEMMVLSTIKEQASETHPDRLVDVCETMGATVANFAEEARQKGLKLSCACGGHAKVLAWEDGVETVLEHLVSNALHYTPRGGTVSVLTTPKESSVEVEVADTGIGIPSDQQDRLFHEFLRHQRPPGLRRHGPGPVDRQGDRRAPGRADRGPVQGRRGHKSAVYAAAGARGKSMTKHQAPKHKQCQNDKRQCSKRRHSVLGRLVRCSFRSF